jgi:hypothetical protein
MRKGADHTLTVLKSIRTARPDGAPIYVIVDNWSGNKTATICAWAAKRKVELCFTPTGASWANPIEPHFGALRSFAIGNSDPPNHPVLARLPALAQRPQAPPGGAGRPTPRTRPHPQRTPAPLGSATPDGRMISKPGQRCRSTH